MSPPPPPGWYVLVPVKHSSVAKSRLAALPAEVRAELARAFPLDCVAAGLASSAVAHVLVITDDQSVAIIAREQGAHVVADEPDAGLNPALAYGADYARATWGSVALAVLSGDLPALRHVELTTALSMVGDHPRAFTADTAGTGTTMLTAAAATDLDPRFGENSAQAHRSSGAVELDVADLPTLRRDVDTDADLRDAIRLGVGEYTRRALERLEVVL